VFQTVALGLTLQIAWFFKPAIWMACGLIGQDLSAPTGGISSSDLRKSDEKTLKPLSGLPITAFYLM
jgi:hypothetical protein